jgi:hypothetical protein
MKLLYKPFGIIVGLLAGLVSRKLFDHIWAQFDDEKAPKATDRDVSTAKVVSAAALQGVVFKATSATVNRYGAKGFYHLTGTWPGQQRPKPKD